MPVNQSVLLAKVHVNCSCLFLEFFICRLYRQQLDIEKAEQLKKPTEDLEVREAASLFSLSEMGWVRLPSQAFADLLMVTEFGHSFEEFLQLEPSLSLSNVYLALYNYQEGGVVMQLCPQLLKAAIDDPGICHIV